jgi:hypothetical protein
MAEQDRVEAMRARVAGDLDLQRRVRRMQDALARGRDPSGSRRSLAELRRIVDESL